MEPGFERLQRRIYTVSELTRVIKNLLEDALPFVWVSGEISNFRVPASGHFYFTLKDAGAQIRAVMFRGQNRSLEFLPEDGMSVVGLGRIGVYEAQGVYQVILEHLEPEGIGALQVAFEQLKARLSEEGLFSEAHKRPLPFLPGKISIVTSPTGAVVHDIIRIIERRFPNVHLEVLPVKVQGEGSVSSIVEAFEIINRASDSDVVILARGGGSLEDLHPFNSEAVARVIYTSRIPVVSAVGHETDFTIADFTADLRAPTPSAAAELVVPVKRDLVEQHRRMSRQLAVAFSHYLGSTRSRVHTLRTRLVPPRRMIENRRLRLDERLLRLQEIMLGNLKDKRQTLLWWTQRLRAREAYKEIERNRAMLRLRRNLLVHATRGAIHTGRASLDQAQAALHALNPSAILGRGYSITRALPQGFTVLDADQVAENQQVEIVLARGRLLCRVEEKQKS